MTKEIKVGNITIGANHPIMLIAGPCVIENEKSVMRHAKEIKRITDMLDVPVIFKSSYDKANRSSISSFRAWVLKAGFQF